MILSLALLLVAVDPPRPIDPSVKITLFAESPQIVTPTGIAVDAKGRVLCIESHTHFRPAGYTGPPADRIRRFEDTDGDGRADRITTLFEGTKHTMALAFGPGGRLYVATRNEVFALDLDDDGIAKGPRTTLVKLDTPGDYPHNGLSGVTFDFDGTLYFGLGENLGAEYKLIGSDGTSLKGGGEGGNIYRCKPDGSKLERVATGFWNPFAMTFDAFGRLFAVDNDPDSRPPCRLLNIVEGGDYGFRFRNGRKGLHPFTSWNGELPGTLPMVAGTGEAPSGIVAYESDQFPKLRGDLLVTSWGDHRIDRFRIVEKTGNATLKAESSPLIVGGEEFRPVGIAMAPDGSLFVSDWVDKSYDLHGKGRIWHIEAREKPARADAGLGIRHPDRATREAAARRMIEAGDLEGLRAVLTGSKAGDERERSTARKALLASKPIDSKTRPAVLLAEPPVVGALGQPIVDHSLTLEGLDRLDWSALEADPFRALDLRNLLARLAPVEVRCRLYDRAKTDDQRLQILLSLRESGDSRAESVIPKALASPDPRIRLAAVLWVGESGLKAYRPQLLESLGQGGLTPAMFEATIAAIDRLDGAKPTASDETGAEGLVAKLATDPKSPPAVRRRALRVLRPDHPALTAERLTEVLASDDPGLRLEAVRTLRDSNFPDRDARLLRLAADANNPASLRAEALAGLSGATEAERELIWNLRDSGSPTLSRQAARSASGLKAPKKYEEFLTAGSSLSGQKFEPIPLKLDPASLPLGRDLKIDAIAKRLSESAPPPGNREEGERIFFHPRGPGCYKCHRVEGRGGRIGPDLTATGPATDRAKLLRSIVEPDAEIAPQFTTWRVARNDGTQLDGVLVAEAVNGDQTYADNEGKLTTIKAADVAERKPLTTSVMPRDLLAGLNPREVRDLLAFVGREMAPPDNTLSSEEKAAGWELLFDGKTLRGWMTSSKTPSKVPVQDGSINPHGCGGYMMVYEKPLGDFVLSLDFKITPKCNSGVFVRTSPLEPREGKDVGFNGIEIAIDDTRTAGYHDTGAIYDLVKPSENAMKPVGEWNHLEITCDGPRISVVLNGEAVSGMDLDKWTQKNKRPDGSAHKFDIAYKDHPRSGYIGLQDHGGDCWYKNIKVRRLNR